MLDIHFLKVIHLDSFNNVSCLSIGLIGKKSLEWKIIRAA